MPALKLGPQERRVFQGEWVPGFFKDLYDDPEGFGRPHTIPIDGEQVKIKAIGASFEAEHGEYSIDLRFKRVL